MQEETIPIPSDDILRKSIKLNRYKIITDIILIFIILGIGIYIIYNFEIFKTLGKDVCRLCEVKTNALCTKINLIQK